jgi:hypothetical protein
LSENKKDNDPRKCKSLAQKEQSDSSAPEEDDFLELSVESGSKIGNQLGLRVNT